MQDLPKVAVNQHEFAQANTAITSTLWGYSHPEAYDFAPGVTNKILETVHVWFKEMAEVKPGIFHGKLSQPVYVSEKERSLIYNVMKILGVTVQFSRKYGLTDLFSCCSRLQKQSHLKLIPKGLWQSVQVRNDHPQNHSVTLTWNPDNRFILQARKPPVLQASPASAAFAQELRDTKVPHDFTIQVGEESFDVHKFQLASHSQYFLNLFSNQMIEARSDVLEIKDYAPETVEALIHYLYSGTLDENATVDDLLALAALAQGVEVLSCLSACEAKLSSHVKTDFEDIYQLALKHELRELLAYCLKYADTEEELSIVRKSFKQENIGMIHELAHVHSISRIQDELTQWKKYNEQAQDLEIVVEEDSDSDLAID